MGSAIISAVSSVYPAKSIYISDSNKNKAAEISGKYGCSLSDNREIAEVCDLIFLAVKPQVLPEVLEKLAPVFGARAERGSRFIFITMAAGVTMESLCAYAGGEYPVIRIMPNTPVSVGAGMILYCANGGVRPEDKELFKELFKAAGTLDELPEKLIDAGSAVSGCGPAFAFMFIHALAEGGLRCGLPYDKALLYASETLIGSAKLLLKSGEHPEKLKDMVCSPAGSTIEGVTVLENGAFRGTVSEAVAAAFERTKELGKK